MFGMVLRTKTFASLYWNIFTSRENSQQKFFFGDFSDFSFDEENLFGERKGLGKTYFTFNFRQMKDSCTFSPRIS